MRSLQSAGPANVNDVAVNDDGIFIVGEVSQGRGKQKTTKFDSLSLNSSDTEPFAAISRVSSVAPAASIPTVVARSGV